MHTINLTAAWDRIDLPDGEILWGRQFGRPTATVGYSNESLRTGAQRADAKSSGSFGPKNGSHWAR